VFVVSPGSTPEKLAVTSQQAPPTDAPDLEGSASEEEEEEEDGDVFAVAVDKFCDVFGYARTAYDILNWFRV
jgi:hypothetical protein